MPFSVMPSTEGGVAAVETMDREVAVLHPGGPAHVGQRQPRAGHQRAQVGMLRPLGIVEHLPAQDHLLDRVLHVDHGRCLSVTV
jgi:hypothetical protein